jgi:hypothetical protein
VATQQKVKFASPGAVFPQVKKMAKKNFKPHFSFKKILGNFLKKKRK